MNQDGLLDDEWPKGGSNPRRWLTALLTLLPFMGFISIGLPDGLTGVAWPFMRSDFGLEIDALGGLLASYTLGYLSSSLLNGRLLLRLGIGGLLGMSCLATGASLLGFAGAVSWWHVISFGAIGGAGAGAIDAGLNTYAATHFSARQVNLLHACYGLGALSGPILMTRVLELGHSWQWGYLIAGAGQLLLAVSFGATRRHWTGPAREGLKPASHPIFGASNEQTLRLPIAWLSAAAFFVYTGIEAAAGAWVFSLLFETRAVHRTTAGTWVGIYWGMLGAGRLLSALFAGSISSQFLLRYCIAGQAVGAVLLWLNLSTPASFLGLALIGLASSPIFPTMIASTPGRIPQAHLPNVMGYQIAAAVVGQSALPALTGILASKWGLEIVSPTLLVATFLLFGLHETLMAIQRYSTQVNAVE